MISLNSYLYQGDTVLKILHNFVYDLETSMEMGERRGPLYHEVCLAHAEYLSGIIKLLEHNDFLTSQSQRIRKFYKYMTDHYPQYAFTFRGRIKSLIRSEEKFNRNLIQLTEQIYQECEGICNDRMYAMLKEKIAGISDDVRDIIAYRIVLSMPKCHARRGQSIEEQELDLIYEIADRLPEFLQELGFQPEKTRFAVRHPSSRISQNWQRYYKDFIEFPTESGYQSLHIVFVDIGSRSRFEFQIRSKAMDDYAEIGKADHESYEKMQAIGRADRVIPEGLLDFYDEAYERLRLLQELDLSEVDVNMFSAMSNVLINDSCGLYRGRVILPYEHLSTFQNDLVE